MSTCPHCGQPFAPRRAGQVYCDASCQARRNRLVYQRRHPEKVRAWIRISKQRRREATRG
jgi:uncharacterized Zn finger protein (UPF0148 family)